MAQERNNGECTFSEVFGQQDLYHKCVMCRKSISEKEYSREHIFPRWLQKKYGLENQIIQLPNGSSLKYNQFLVPCCKKCNGEAMSEWENKIAIAVEKGFSEFKKLDANIVVWWIYKIYYSKLIKESQLLMDRKDPSSARMMEENTLQKYNMIYWVMTNLIRGYTFDRAVPFELYIYKIDDETSFYYKDDINSHTVFLKMGEIAVLCALDSYGVLKKHYEEEIKALDKMDKVYYPQAMELFIKMHYYRSHYGIITAQKYIEENNVRKINVEIVKLWMLRAFNEHELFDTLAFHFCLYGMDSKKLHYEEGKRISVILNKQE